MINIDHLVDELKRSYDRIDHDRDNNIVFIFADGGCTGNGKKHSKASYAYCIINGTTLIKNSGLISESIMGYAPSNNVGELMAIYNGLIRFDDHDDHDDNYNRKIVIVSDSMYCLNALSTWYESWVKKGITKKKKNIGIIKKCYDKIKKLNNRYDIEFMHVSGHVNSCTGLSSHDTFLVKGNTLVDAMCQNQLLT